MAGRRRSEMKPDALNGISSLPVVRSSTDCKPSFRTFSHAQILQKSSLILWLLVTEREMMIREEEKQKEQPHFVELRYGDLDSTDASILFSSGRGVDPDTLKPRRFKLNGLGRLHPRPHRLSKGLLESFSRLFRYDLSLVCWAPFSAKKIP